MFQGTTGSLSVISGAFAAATSPEDCVALKRENPAMEPGFVPTPAVTSAADIDCRYVGPLRGCMSTLSALPFVSSVTYCTNGIEGVA
jgi:hypothetical protein